MLDPLLLKCVASNPKSFNVHYLPLGGIQQLVFCSILFCSVNAYGCWKESVHSLVPCPFSTQRDAGYQTSLPRDLLTSYAIRVLSARFGPYGFVKEELIYLDYYSFDHGFCCRSTIIMLSKTSFYGSFI